MFAAKFNKYSTSPWAWVKKHIGIIYATNIKMLRTIPISNSLYHHNSSCFGIVKPVSNTYAFVVQTLVAAGWALHPAIAAKNGQMRQIRL